MSEKKVTVPAGTEKTVDAVSNISLTQGNGKVKSLILQTALEKAQSKEIVEAIQTKYPKYDKTIQSKVKSGEYGIEWTDEAAKAVIEVILGTVPEKKKDRHKMSKRLSARLPDKMHAKLISVIKGKGFESVQSWLIYVVTDYLRKEMAR